MNAATTTTPTLYEALRAAGIDTDSHESDLYVLDTPETRAIIRAHARESLLRGSSFIADSGPWQGKRCIEVPFAYDPYWQARARTFNPNDDAPDDWDGSAPLQ